MFEKSTYTTHIKIERYVQNDTLDVNNNKKQIKTFNYQRI